MEYNTHELSRLAGISARTLRYYDEIGLLRPCRTAESGYRFYGEKEVELLQQILFYRERGLELGTIQEIICQPDFDILEALDGHLSALIQQKERLDTLIQTVKLTIATMKGESKMDDTMKFEAFKNDLVDKNEQTYGKEIREKYGDEEVNSYNQKILGLSEKEYEQFRDLETAIRKRLEEAVRSGIKPESEAGRETAFLHRDWLSYTWKKYSPRMHKSLTDMYVLDERFKDYYDREVKGCADFLMRAVKYWIED
ncbi:MerR family transcriptional regulator [Qiania dongpingensis]|uniref:MerR family transcriptional regulator n=1 Tax=Qiania dongpingensis TaxID=2763669 RepID=A0A7G9G2G8_9FIRM|nr:MerR family transcriptional regulator [Qiania dongpingensis]QNM05000.1 MerR family transcriptional regulator [Qiania dongpingensis]